MAQFANPNLKGQMADALEDIFANVCARMMPRAGSPIERTMFEAVVGQFYIMTGKLPVVSGQSEFPSSAHWRITPQAQIGAFRVDFLIETADTGLRVVIECDGHEYHERTKVQARKDRSRDRELQGMGYIILRYTGSEIFADPLGCALDIWKKIESRAEEKAA